MPIVTIDGRDIVVGLRWKTLQGILPEAKEISALSREDGRLKTGVILKGGYTTVGLVPSLDRAKGLPAGAAWVATAHPTDAIVLIEPIGNDRFWFCATRKGSPIIDVLCSELDIERLIDEVLEHGDAKVYSREGFVSDSDAGTFFDVIEDTNPTLVKHIVGWNPTHIMAVAVAATMVLAGLGGYLFFKHRSQVEAQKRVARVTAEAAAKEKADGERIRQEAIAAVESQVKSKSVEAPSPENLINAWFYAFSELPVAVAGWALDSIQCGASKACDVTFKREKFGTTNSLMAAALERGWNVAGVINDDAVISVPFDAKLRNGTLSLIPSEADFINDFSSALQSMGLAGVKTTRTAAELVLPPTPKQPPSAAGSPPAPPVAITPWRVGTFSLNGVGLFSAHDSRLYLNYDNVAVHAMKLNVNTKIWTIEGSYAIK